MSASREKRGPIVVAGTSVKAGQRLTIDLSVADLYTHSSLPMPVQVIHGRRDGPVLFVTAAVHGDELCGVEILRRLLRRKSINALRGTLIAVPIVNVHGFIDNSRYLPDRRDLNRSFPGSPSGSLAGRVAHVIASEIITLADFGIDLHTGAVHRANLPQIRADLDDEQTFALAKAFGAPVILDSETRDGSLREHASKLNVPTLLYEAGEALRFDEASIRGGVRGVLNIMRTIGMLGEAKTASEPITPVVAESSRWVRAPTSGIVQVRARLGDTVESGQPVATVSDPFGETEQDIPSPMTGVVIGRSNLPVAHEGEALLHIATIDNKRSAALAVARFRERQQTVAPA
ncbi:MAG: succinylglutamate desuccinylase/aspartoacylase family protein [Pseudomonadota bacterium]